MDLGARQSGLTPLEYDVIGLVYLDGRTADEAARTLAVEPRTVAAALARAYHRIADGVLAGDDRDVVAEPAASWSSAAGPQLQARGADTAWWLQREPIRRAG